MKTKTIVKQNKKQNKKTQKNLGKRRQTRKNNLKRIKRQNRRTRRRGGMRWPFGSKKNKQGKPSESVGNPIHGVNAYGVNAPSQPLPSPPVNKSPPAVEDPLDIKRMELVQMNSYLNDYRRKLARVEGKPVNSTEDILRKERLKTYKNNDNDKLDIKKAAKAEEMKGLQNSLRESRSENAISMAKRKEYARTARGY